MNVVKFAEEFTQLIVRWTRPVATDGEGGDNLSIPLTNQQILNAIQDVLKVMLGATLQTPDYSEVTTPAIGISICTPSAPMVIKNLDESSSTLARYKSLDTLLPQSNNINGVDDDQLTSKSEEKMEPMDIDACGPEEKKVISQSSPAIHLGTVSRSDTFIREEEAKAAAEKNQVEDDVFAKLEATVCDDKIKTQSILHKIKILREYAFNFISKIDDVEKEVHPQATKPIRRLSSIGVFSGGNRSSAIIRAGSSAKHRRSSRGFLATPTSSKLNTPLTEKEQISARRKTIGPVSMYSKATVTSSIDSKKSPGNKAAKGSKYAHVQSTIPKVSVHKRKAP